MDRIDCDRMFVAVVDLGSFAAAARKLGTSSGQASKLVSRLESELGVQLLKRTTRALAPTEIGKTYHLRMKELLAEFDSLEASVRNASGLPAGRLRVTAPVTFGTGQLVPVLLDFARLHPQIQLDVSFNDRMANLVDEGFDLAIRIGQVPDSSLVARKLCETRMVLVASPGYLTMHPPPRQPADLLAHDCIIDTNSRDAHSWRFKDGEVHALNGRLAFSNADACLAAAEAGVGIAPVPSFVAGPLLREGRVIRVLPDYEAPGLPVHAVYPPARHLALRVRALVDYLAQAFRGQPDWDRGW